MSAFDLLVPETTLQEAADRVQAAVDQLEGSCGIATDDFNARRALRNYLLFSDRAGPPRAGIGNLSDEALFYNRYYWFLRFIKLRESVEGHDAGLHQQAFQILEAAERDVDWQFIQHISEHAGFTP